MSARLINLYDLTREQLRAQLVRWEFSPVHAGRLWNYLYLELAESFDVMPELPAKVRDRLKAEASIGVLTTALATDSADGFTRKYLLGLADAERIETVLMRYTGRVTACVSSQVGCAMGCVFCATGQMGYTRHLTPGEIVAQAVHVARALRARPTCHLIGDIPSGDGATKSAAGRAYFITNGEPVVLWDWINELLRGLGEPPVVKNISLRAASVLGALGEAAWKVLPLRGEPPMTRFVAKELATDHWFDLTAARRDLGYVPRVSMAAGTAELISSLKGGTR